MGIKKILAAGLIFGIGMLLCACIKKPSAVVNKVHVGMLCYNQSDTFLDELAASFKKQLTELGSGDLKTTVTLLDAAGQQRIQNDQAKELIDAGCNVLCVNLVDRSEPGEIINLAKKNDVPVIFFNREPVREDMMQWDKLYYVGADARQSGVMQGELAVDTIRANGQIDRNRDGKIQYVVLEGEPGHQDAIVRTESAIATLKKNGIQLEKLSSGIANWNRAQAQNRMMHIISQYQNKIELVLANNDDMALGAIDAYKKLNYTESALPVFLGIDGTDPGLQAVLDSKMAGTVYNDKEGQAGVMAKLALALVTGKGMEKLGIGQGKCIYLPYAKVTRENVLEIINSRIFDLGK